MKKFIFNSGVLVLSLLLLSLVVNLDAGEQTFSVKEIIEKNIEASGGKARIDGLTAISFETERFIYRRMLITYYATDDGKMKIVEGDGELVEKVTVVEPGGIKVKSFTPAAALTALDKTQLTCFAGLYGGGFTLKNFKNKLSLGGMKKYGPEKHYVLTTRIKDHDVDFYIDAKDYTLKRTVFKGMDANQGRYESTYDFGPVKESNGLKIPSSWFRSFIGPKERNDTQVNIRNFKANIQLEKGFFKKLDINFGKVTAAGGYLEGNTVASLVTPRKNVVISVNWTADDAKKAGFKIRDKLQLKIGNHQQEAIFMQNPDQLTPQDVNQENKNVFLIGLGVDEYLTVVMFGETHKPWHDKHKKLLKISAKKINQ